MIPESNDSQHESGIQEWSQKINLFDSFDFRFDSNNQKSELNVGNHLNEES